MTTASLRAAYALIALIGCLASSALGKRLISISRSRSLEFNAGLEPSSRHPYSHSLPSLCRRE